MHRIDSSSFGGVTPNPGESDFRTALSPIVGPVPSASVLAYARRLARRQSRVSVEDAEDIVADALLDFVRAGRRGMRLGDGLFLVIVRRRVCDFWRRHRRDEALGAAVSLACGPDEGPLLRRSIEEGLRRVRRTRVDRERLVGVTTRILAGDTFAEACTATGIPRGSQNRVRQTLRTLLEAEF